MSTRKITNPLALAVLALLSEQPSHPYEMSAVMRSRHWHNNIKLNYGSLYTVIESLVKESLIQAQETMREGNRPERTIYHITDIGRIALRSWLSELLRKPEKEYLKFEAGLTLLLHLPQDEAAKLLEERALCLEKEIFEDKEQIKMLHERFNLDRSLLLESEYSVTIKAAQLEWIDSIISDIKGGRLGWVNHKN